MKIKITNIEGLIPYKVFLCDVDFEYCELLDSNFRKTTFEMEYNGPLSGVGIKVVTKNGKEYKKVFSTIMQSFVDCPLEISTQSINPSPNNADGSATVLISNSFGQPDITWSTGDHSLIITGLTGGTYSVTVTDPSKTNCFKTEEFTLYEDFYIQVENLQVLSFSELICQNDYQINWGDGFVEYESTNTTPSKKYYTPYTGIITIRNTSLSNITSISDSFALGNVVYETKELNKLIGLLKFENNATVTKGKISELPSYIENLKLYGEVTGNCSELPINLISLVTDNQVILSGETIDLPSGLLHVDINGKEITGDVSNLPINLTGLTIHNGTTISGDTSNLPVNLSVIKINGLNTISGLIDNLPLNLEYCEISGENTMSGDLSNLPQNLKTLILGGNNTITGDIINLPLSLNDTLYLTGLNTIGGDISTLPTNLLNVFLDGVGTNPGEYVYGNIDSINQNIISLTVLGNNQLSGEFLSSSTHTQLTYLNIEGDNIITGNLETLPPNLYNIKILGQNSLNIFSGDSKTYWPNIYQINVKPITPFDQQDINKLLNSLVSLKAKPFQVGYIVIKGYLDLTNEITKNNYDYLISEGFKFDISPTL